MIGRSVAERFPETRIAFDIVPSSSGGVWLASSTTAFPGPGAPAAGGPYGNRCASVVGVSGSCSSRRSFQTASPFVDPSCVCSADRSCARDDSSPPPAPNRAPSRHVIATTSVRVQSATGSCVECRNAFTPAT
jgi:hypothetical protein